MCVGVWGGGGVVYSQCISKQDSYFYSLPALTEWLGQRYQVQDPVFYERKFIAEYNGERAGLLCLKLHGDPAER